MVSLLKCIALESLGNFWIALTVSLTTHSQIHTNLRTLTIEVVNQTLVDFWINTFRNRLCV